MRLARALVFAALAACLSTGARAEGSPGSFDFYVLALSWSPTYCSTQGSPEDSRQCGDDAGFGFIVHGLWPQYEQGWPEFCAGEDAERIPARFADEMRDIMPERRLVFSEWRKHGTCTGLSPAGYFALTREAYKRVTIPAELAEPDRDRTIGARAVEQAFVAANPGLKADGIAVSCADGFLEEIRICLTKDLAFRPCREVDRSGCRQERLALPAAN